jgi:hypothetical protein
VRHYAALALGAYAEFRRAIHSLPMDVERGSRPDLGYLIGFAVSATAAVVALTNTDPAEVGEELWGLTSGAGALNGEWEDYLDGVLVGLGINPADIDDYLDPADFAAAVSR